MSRHARISGCKHAWVFVYNTGSLPHCEMKTEGVGGFRLLRFVEWMHIFGKVFCVFDLLVLRGYCSNHLLSACTSLNRTSATLLLPVQPKVFIFQGKWNSGVFPVSQKASSEGSDAPQQLLIKYQIVLEF